MRRICITALIISLVIIASCTQSGIMEEGTELPEGKYPLVISSVTISGDGGRPRGAKVVENESGNSVWEWNGSEQISVNLGGYTALYTLNPENILSSDRTLYWPAPTADIIAWYPIDKAVDLSDQSDGLSYVLKAVIPDAKLSTINLSFNHQLAKVRVELIGTRAVDVKSVKVYGYTSCINTEGTVSTDGARQDWITMHKVNDTTYEANVVPGTEINKLKVNSTETTLADTIRPVAGNMHEIKLTVN